MLIPETQDPLSCCAVSLIHMAARPTLQPIGKRMGGKSVIFPFKSRPGNHTVYTNLQRRACLQAPPTRDSGKCSLSWVALLLLSKTGVGEGEEWLLMELQQAWNKVSMHISVILLPERFEQQYIVLREAYNPLELEIASFFQKRTK